MQAISIFTMMQIFKQMRIDKYIEIKVKDVRLLSFAKALHSGNGPC